MNKCHWCDNVAIVKGRLFFSDKVVNVCGEYMHDEWIADKENI